LVTEVGIRPEGQGGTGGGGAKENKNSLEQIKALAKGAGKKDRQKLEPITRQQFQKNGPSRVQVGGWGGRGRRKASMGPVA